MQFDFQDPASYLMEGIIDFHHDIQFYLVVIVTLVAWCLFSIIYEFGFRLYVQSEVLLQNSLQGRRDALVLKNVTHGTVLEIVWTLVPVVVLVGVAVPSFALLYAIDEIVEPSVTVKAIGHQWYWSYEYSECMFGNLMFDSYMIPEADLLVGQPRLLEVDRKLWLPTHTNIRVLVTSTDVLHAWAVPALGVKMDCVPGRLNQVSIYITREGVFYGQCSELCGVNHGFMPIAVKAVPLGVFTLWTECLILLPLSDELHDFSADIDLVIPVPLLDEISNPDSLPVESFELIAPVVEETAATSSTPTVKN